MRLKVNETYIYYDFPIIFSALDEGGNAFICLFAEETDLHLKYICVQISQTTLMELEHNWRDIRSLFVHPEKVFNLLLNAKSEEPVDVVETSEDITPFLPEEDLFIGKSREEEVSQSVKFVLPSFMNNANYSFTSIPPDYAVEVMAVSPYSQNSDIFLGDFQCLTIAA
ncbi:MAG: hypothetical protein LBK08_02920 [Treponema sp.]|jgi:hypothetical protein|nr:hypothetical protein [Treponema sp.]